VGKAKKRLTQAERTEISDLAMLEAATDIILDVGTQNMTLKDVGEKAGFSRSLASLRFGSKEGLFTGLQQFHRKIWIKNWQNFLKESRAWTQY